MARGGEALLAASLRAHRVKKKGSSQRHPHREAEKVRAEILVAGQTASGSRMCSRTVEQWDNLSSGLNDWCACCRSGPWKRWRIAPNLISRMSLDSMTLTDQFAFFCDEEVGSVRRDRRARHAQSAPTQLRSPKRLLVRLNRGIARLIRPDRPDLLASSSSHGALDAHLSPWPPSSP